MNFRGGQGGKRSNSVIAGRIFQQSSLIFALGRLEILFTLLPLVRIWAAVDSRTGAVSHQNPFAALYVDFWWKTPRLK